MAKQKPKKNNRTHLSRKATALLRAGEYRKAHVEYQALLNAQEASHSNEFSNFREFQDYITIRTQLFVCEYLAEKNEMAPLKQIDQLNKAKATLLVLMHDIHHYTNENFYHKFIKSNVYSYLSYLSTKTFNFEYELTSINNKLSAVHEKLGDTYFDNAEMLDDKHGSIKYYKLAENAFEQGDLSNSDPVKSNLFKESRAYCHFIIFNLSENVQDKQYHASKLIKLEKEINHDILSDWSLLVIRVYLYKAHTFLKDSETAKMYAEKIADCGLFQDADHLNSLDIRECLIEIKALLDNSASQQVDSPLVSVTSESPMSESSGDDLNVPAQDTDGEPEQVFIENYEKKVAKHISSYQGKFIADGSSSSVTILASLEDESMLLNQAKKIEFHRFKMGKRYSVAAIGAIDKAIAANYQLFCQGNVIQYSKLIRLSSQIPTYIELLRVTHDQSKRMMLAICIELIRYAIDNNREMFMANQVKEKELMLGKTIHEVKKLKGIFKREPDVFLKSTPKNARMLLNDLDIRVNAEVKRAASGQVLISGQCAAAVQFTPCESLYYTKLNSFFSQNTYSINERHIINANLTREKLRRASINNPLQVHLHVKARMLSEATDSQLENYLRSLNMENNQPPVSKKRKMR